MSIEESAGIIEFARCAKCGKINSPKAHKCERCNARLYLRCSSCKTKNLRVREECSQCKASLHKSSLGRWMHRINFKRFKHWKRTLYIGLGIIALVVLGYMLSSHYGVSTNKVPIPQ
jgi:hypothetical protein